MHRPTLAAAGACDLAHELGHHLFGVQPPGQGVAVVPVVGDYVVAVLEDRYGADGHGLLADVLVEEPSDLALLVRAAALLLEPADQQHLPV